VGKPASVSGQDEAQNGTRRLRGQRQREPRPHPEQESRRQIDHPEGKQGDDQDREGQVEERHVHRLCVGAEGDLYPGDSALRVVEEDRGGDTRGRGKDGLDTWLNAREVAHV